jgi:dTDP-4-amino-4,6-dideoxygalactose transaminase
MDINVTKPFLPPITDYEKYLRDIWAREWLTNNGPLVNELELKLKEKLDIDHLLFVGNGTIALQIAIKALGLSGEVITTPFSYVATTSSLVWEGCQPVMVDICPDSLNIDAGKIEQAITSKTTGILATHVYGNPCDVVAINQIAEKYGLKVIYDAAHAFGVEVGGRSLFSYGDVSTTSFHATKLFHTIEGGAVVSRSPQVLKRMAEMRNFGHVSPTDFLEVGVNGKNSEFHAAMGLCNLRHIDDILSVRRELSLHYDEYLNDLPLARPKIYEGCKYNYSYYPIIFESEKILLSTVELLNLNKIFPRRYFYPSLSRLPYVGEQCTPISEEIAKRVLCLPLYHDLSREEVGMVCRLVKRELRN